MPACGNASFSARAPAILKLISSESTEWYLPSVTVALRSTSGKPWVPPLAMASAMPVPTAGTSDFGMAPPTTSDSNTYPSPGGRGSKRTLATPNWPRPPDCFLCRPSTSTVRVMVSR